MRLRTKTFLILIPVLIALCVFSTRSTNAMEILTPNQNSLWTILSIRCDDEKPLKFVVMGDTRSNPKKFTEIINLTNSLKPDFIIHLGDIVEKGERSEFEAIRKLFDKFESPLLAVPGNHEISKSMKNLQNFVNYFGFTEETFDLCGIRFILVDNSKGVLSKEHLKRIKEDLNTDKIRMIFMHVPPNPPWTKHSMTGGSKELVSLLESTGCEYAFFAHIHGYDHRMIGKKCKGYISGGGGAELNGYGLAKEIYHVLLVTVDKGNINVEMIPLK